MFGAAGSVTLYLAYTWAMASYNFVNFAVSHSHLPTVPEGDTNVDWVLFAAQHTMNIAPGRSPVL